MDASPHKENLNDSNIESLKNRISSAKKSKQYVCYVSSDIPVGKIFVSDMSSGKEIIAVRIPVISYSSVQKLETVEVDSNLRSTCESIGKVLTAELMQTLGKFAIINSETATKLCVDIDGFGDVITIFSEFGEVD